jgi:hypothetical protein
VFNPVPDRFLPCHRIALSRILFGGLAGWNRLPGRAQTRIFNLHGYFGKPCCLQGIFIAYTEKRDTPQEKTLLDTVFHGGIASILYIGERITVVNRLINQLSRDGLHEKKIFPFSCNRGSPGGGVACQPYP